MFAPDELAAELLRFGFTHVVWVPDSATGRWEAALEARLRLVRVCREGEAWPLAAGLHLGGALPLVVMQTTGLLESGDALRNVLFDLQLPLYAFIGVRNALVPDSLDSAKTLAVPFVQAFGLDHMWLRTSADLAALARHVQCCRAAGKFGAALLAEGPP